MQARIREFENACVNIVRDIRPNVPLRNCSIAVVIKVEDRITGVCSDHHVSVRRFVYKGFICHSSIIDKNLPEENKDQVSVNTFLGKMRCSLNTELLGIPH